jgi:hypothetical protein
LPGETIVPVGVSSVILVTTIYPFALALDPIERCLSGSHSKPVGGRSCSKRCLAQFSPLSSPSETCDQSIAAIRSAKPSMRLERDTLWPA